MIEKTRVVYQAPVGAVIWNMIPAGADRIIIEERNEHTRQVSIVCLTATGTFRWRNTNLPDSWWINLNGVTATHVILHQFENTSNPDQVKLIALQVDTGQEVAVPVQFEYTIEALRPFVYVQGEPDFETVQKFLRQQLNQEIFLGAEYLETENLILISYYTGQPAAYTNKLACFSHKGLLYWTEEIGTNLKGMGIGTFFIATNTVFFVKNKTDLVTFRIV
ncbi:MAG: hypothetical protein UZ12_BCD005000381 [Bacteroidetes bacterium OLB12]|nr:MAG: hypothetical protein UZ12_BCD005000381 [Bacteroidetes bacterium OLB12]HNU42289.1 DUF4905 domain-containing protein [Cyclobacteriaceae bacterium]